MTIFTTSKIILILQTLSILEPISTLTFYQMREFHLVISFLVRSDREKTFPVWGGSLIKKILASFRSNCHGLNVFHLPEF